MADLGTPSEVVDAAYARWCSIHGRNEFRTFWRYAGISNPARDLQTSFRHYHIPPDVRRRIESLNGPHGMTLIKAAFHARKK